MSGATGATATAQFPPSVTANDGLDDFAGIQNAINSANAAGGGVVPLPAGELDTTGHLQLKTGVELLGQGDASSATPTIIKAISGFLNTTGPQGGYPVLTTNGAANVTASGLVLDQNGGVLVESDSERLSAYLLDLRNSTNALVDSVSTRNPGTYSIAAVGSNHFCIKGSDTQVGTNGVYSTSTQSGQLDGIHVLDSSFGDVDNSFADQRFNDYRDGDDALVAHTINASTHDISYVGDKAHGGSGGDGMQLAVGAFPIYNITVQSTEVYDSPEGIRTGGYAGSLTAGVDHILLGGDSLTGNNIHDLRGGIAFPTGGNAVDIGRDIPTSSAVINVTVTYNRVCNAGSILVRTDPTNLVASNTGC